MAARKTTYETKRDFDRTPEPGGRRKAGKAPIFVVQKHDARRLHYDFRLEVDGALKSWAVPKGPSLDPGVKRLAVPTEDHPMEYAAFEGVIPEGEYGAGPVLIWDRGTFENVTEKKGKIRPAHLALRDGHLLFRLNGKKLKGAFALQRTGEGDDARWLLVKMRDEYANERQDPVKTAPKSAKTGRTLRQVERGAEPRR
jgi:DNA ligase D-like protein (predicted 3'-phosphoesterase)